MATNRQMLVALLIGVIVGAVVPFGSGSETTEAAAIEAVVDAQLPETDAPPALVDQSPAPHMPVKRSARN